MRVCCWGAAGVGTRFRGDGCVCHGDFVVGLISEARRATTASGVRVPHGLVPRNEDYGNLVESFRREIIRRTYQFLPRTETCSGNAGSARASKRMGFVRFGAGFNRWRVFFLSKAGSCGGSRVSRKGTVGPEK